MNLLTEKGYFGELYINMLVIMYAFMAFGGIILPKGFDFGYALTVFLFVLTIYYSLFRNRFKFYFMPVYLFILFVFFLILFTSSNLYYSYRMWYKMTAGLLCLAVGFNIMHCGSNIQKFWRNLIIIIHIYLIYAVLSNLLHFGGGYGKDETVFETGNLFTEALFSNVYILIMIPFFLRYNIHKTYILLVMGIAAVLIIVNMKRTPIACGIISVITFISVLYFLNIRYGSHVKRSSKKYIMVFFLMFGGAFLFFHGTIEKQIEIRQKKLVSDNLENEGRFLELKYIYEENVQNGGIVKFLFGKETFNIVGTYAKGKFGKRQIHEDYGMLLHSTGIVGLIWYCCIQLFLLILPYRRKFGALFVNNHDNRLLLATYTTLIVVHFVSMTSGVIRMSFSESIYYLLLGLLLRVFYEQYYENNNITQHVVMSDVK